MSDLRISSHLYHGLGNDTLGIYFFYTEKEDDDRSTTVVSAHEPLRQLRQGCNQHAEK